jgi:hypothetical protein
MSETPFHQTAMGRDFYERTIPALVREISRLNDILAKLAEQHAERPVGGKSSGEKDEP